MDSFDPLSSHFWLVVGTALLCGGMVGLERQLRGKPVGVRTSCLICLSTAVFLHLGSTVVTDSSDSTRVLGQVVTGVGFLGGGVMLAREGIVTGVTTASVIWTLAAIGSAIGLGHFAGAIALAVVTVIVLAGIDAVENGIRSVARGAHGRVSSNEDE